MTFTKDHIIRSNCHGFANVIDDAILVIIRVSNPSPLLSPSAPVEDCLISSSPESIRTRRGLQRVVAVMRSQHHFQFLWCEDLRSLEKPDCPYGLSIVCRHLPMVWDSYSVSKDWPPGSPIYLQGYRPCCVYQFTVNIGDGLNEALVDQDS